MEFDASIDLTARRLRNWSWTPAEAVEAVRTAIQAVPGARWVDVVYCGDAFGDDTPRLFHPGLSSRDNGPAWLEMDGIVARTIDQTVKLGS